MEKNKKSAVILKYFLSFLVATTFFFLTISLRDIYSTTDQQEIYRTLSDGFAIPGVFFLCVGVLVWLSNQNAFDGIGYAVKHLFTMLIPLFPKKHETYQEFRESRNRVSGFGFLFIVGGLFLLLAIIFMLLFLL